MAPETDVLIAGGGPTGLVLALWLYKQGVKFRIVDPGTGPVQNSRALVVHARILELYRQLDLADDLLELGYKLPATNVWVEGQHRAHISLWDFGKELTPYPFLLIVPQDVHERVLEQRLNSHGIFVERRTKLESFVDKGPSITAKLVRQDDGTEMTCEAKFIVGCDGAHSVVRHEIGAKYEGDTYVPLFYIVDLEFEEQDSPLLNGEANLSFVEDTFNLILPYGQGQRVRLIGTTIPKVNGRHKDHDSTEPHPKVTFEDVLPDIQRASKIEIKKKNWFSPYRCHHRVSSIFHKNRAFLVGDAAHIHSPVGGQGMNTGIMDAINLAWKLATVIKQDSMTDEAKTRLLQSYEPERRAFALSVVGATDRGFTLLTSPGFLSHMLRVWVIPYVAPLVLRFKFARMEIFKRASQLVCSYRGSPLSQEAKGSETVQPGDRMPWAKTEASDNFATLGYLCWQLHVYGESQPELSTWCQKMNVRVHVFNWDKLYDGVGLKRDAAYLIRPDHYVAGIFEGNLILHELDEYFSTRGLMCWPYLSD
ncbi:hypothetical protein N7523_008112 [Penicillium sp. IBT 18751x]|nr:hypothetical protein N7523_008112 [Penicillium sp. IBT 18751x]